MPSHSMDPARLWTLGSRYSFLPLVWWEMYWAACETVSYRLLAITAAGASPDARQQRENLRMVQEKAEAGMETMQALAKPNAALSAALSRQWWEGIRIGFDASSRMLKPQRYYSMGWNWPLLFAESMADTVDTAVRPWHRRVTANARRLRKRRQ
jgi:hypothetical protein